MTGSATSSASSCLETHCRLGNAWKSRFGFRQRVNSSGTAIMGRTIASSACRVAVGTSDNRKFI